MLKFLLRRFANYLVLVVLATCMGYFLAASALHPRQIYEGRNPPPPEASIDKTLDDLNLNDKTPVVTRFKRWAGDALHGDFGRTVFGQKITDEMPRGHASLADQLRRAATSIPLNIGEAQGRTGNAGPSFVGGVVVWPGRDPKIDAPKE